MNVRQLINKLKTLDHDKIVLLCDPDGVGWDNVGIIKEDHVTVKILQDGNGIFHES